VSLTQHKPTPAENAFREAYEALDASGGRAQSWAAFAEQGLPHKRVEEWKWSDVRQTLRQPRSQSGAVESDISPAQAFGAAAAAEIVFANGRLIDEPELPEGVVLHRQDEANPPGERESYPLAALACALTLETGAYVLEINGEVSRPIRLRLISEGEGAHHLRLSVVVRENASATILESHEGEGAPYANTLVELGLQRNARLNRYIIHQGSADVVNTTTTLGHVAERAGYHQAILTFGGALTRFDARLTCEGDETDIRLDGAYLLDGQRHADLTSVVDHRGEGSVTQQVVKGVVDDRGRGAFQGRFDVARGAQKTDAQMQHHALLLSERAQSNAKPELMIFADDVQCAHGNTVGALDENALFYMRSRGIDAASARALLIEAFISEAFAHIPDDVQEEFIARSREWLEKK